MNQINNLVGSQIRAFRKAKGLTLQQLADCIHKSRGTVSKYENGEIVIDAETLYDIGQVLEVSPNELFDYQPNQLPRYTFASKRGSSPFYNARRLYFYFYDGRYGRLKDGIIDIVEEAEESEQYEATLSVSTMTSEGRMSETFYRGDVLYSDMLIRFSFVNQCNALETDFY